MLRRVSFFAAISTFLAVQGCSCTVEPVPDGGDAGMLPDGALPDGQLPPDAGPFDGGPDGGRPSGELFPPVTITTCPGDALPPPATGRCDVTRGTAGLLFTGDVLKPGEVLRGGQVLVGADGVIDCVGCDCSAAPGAAEATTVVCPDVAISPGMINAHDHITFAGAWPYGDTRAGETDLMTDERYEHRHDWGGERGHTRIPATGGMSSTGEMQWLEFRQLVSGTTSIFGSGGPRGFIRNLDNATENGLPNTPAIYETFPLDDGADNTQLASGCGYPYCAGGLPCNFSATSTAPYVAHVGEGIDAVTRNEFACLREGMTDIVAPRSAFIHGAGLLPADILEMATESVELIWSPRTNITLYGDTARVTEYAYAGVPIALGTDWVRTGSMNMLRELACADSFNQNHLAGFFPDDQLWLMPTRNSARALGVDDMLGTIAVGQIADLALYDASTDRDYRAVLAADPDDVVLVTIAGAVRFGDAAVVDAIVSGCESMGDVCGQEKRACIAAEECFDDCTATDSVPMSCTWALLSNCGMGQYPLFSCGDPPDEPSCLPARNSMGPLPDSMVDGSSYYAGMSSADDFDGDGITNASDNCVGIFNPIRPLDNGMQANVDGDALGDACDPCALDADTTACTPVDPDDRDHDGVTDLEDNCTGLANPDQLDTDGDGMGDLCDACETFANPAGAPCLATIYEARNGTYSAGDTVRIDRSVVTAVGPRGFTIQMPTDHASYTVPAFSGIFVFTSAAPALMDGTLITAGMTVDLVGDLADFFGAPQLEFAVVTMSAVPGAAPVPIVASPADLNTGGAMAAQLLNVLVRVEDVAVTNAAPPPTRTGSTSDGEFEVDSILRVDDFFFLVSPFVTNGESFASITGVTILTNDRHKLMPRSATDYVAGDPELASFAPMLTYVREGAPAGSTFPVPLTVTLQRASATDTPVTIASTAPELTLTDVIVPAGMLSATVPVAGSTAGVYPITATVGGAVLMAMVQVLAVDQAVTDFTLTPGTAMVLSGGTQTFTVTLDIPAPSTGATIDLVETTGGTIPASVMVPADAISATFDYVAPAADTTGTLTATLQGPGVMRTADISVFTAPALLVINEVDYDQPGTDNTGAEYVEIYNPAGRAVQLAGLQLILVNGSASPGSVYRTINLSMAGTELAAGGYIVVRASASVMVPAGVATIALPGTADQIQNGAPDAMFVWDSVRMTVHDALSYEDTGAPLTVAIGTPSMSVNLVEGTAAMMSDSGTIAGALSRLPNGSDTNVANTDWRFTACRSPGAANAMTCP